MGKTQTEDVLAYLQKHGSITSLQAIEMFGATRLSDIIFRLRNRGYEIHTERFKVKTRYGTHTSPAKYTLKKEKEL